MNEKLLKEKAESYLACYNGQCPRREHCLHWIVGPYVPENLLTKECVNVTNAQMRAGRCFFYRPDTLRRMKRGMLNFYEEMPRRVAVGVKKQLEATYGHTTYYAYRNGKLPITPEMQEQIAQVCREHGWNEPPVYDAETEEFDW